MPALIIITIHTAETVLDNSCKADIIKKPIPNVKNETDTTLNFQVKKHGENTILFDETLSFTITNDMFNPDWVEQNAQVLSHGIGRGAAVIFNLHSTNMVLRHYRRGGMIGRLIRDRFVKTKQKKSRAFLELALLSKMHTLRLPVPKPIAARLCPSGLTYTADILIEAIPNSKTLLDALANGEITKQHWIDLGRTVATFHKHGIDHTDLNIRNILIDNASNFWLIDFDKCSQRKHGQWTSSNLSRLKRSLEKELSKGEFKDWNDEHWQSFQNAYAAAN